MTNLLCCLRQHPCSVQGCVCHQRLEFNYRQKIAIAVTSRSIKILASRNELAEAILKVTVVELSTEQPPEQWELSRLFSLTYQPFVFRFRLIYLRLASL